VIPTISPSSSRAATDRPATQVLDALARALQLDEHATEHLHAARSARARVKANC
jgi:hypothetical protein